MKRFGLVLILISVFFSVTSRGDGAKGIPGVPKSVLFFLAEQVVTKSFFRHASWKPPVTETPHNIPIQEEPLGDKEFLRRHPSISHERAVEIYFMIMVMTMLFEENNIKALPVGGTMLGLLRNKGQMSHDDDADFVLKEEDYQRLSALQDAFKTFGLRLRDMPGLGVQVCLKEDHSWPWMLNRFLVNAAIRGLKKLGISIQEISMTTHGFIDLNPVVLDEETDVYRYAGDYAHDAWFQQTIPRPLIEGDYSQYSFGPTKVFAPRDRKAMEDNILHVYPHSLDYIMATPNHSTTLYNPDQRLCKLTDKQKRPFPLTAEDLQKLDDRLSKVGLKRDENGKAQRLSNILAAPMKNRQVVRKRRVTFHKAVTGRSPLRSQSAQSLEPDFPYVTPVAGGK